MFSISSPSVPSVRPPSPSTISKRRKNATRSSRLSIAERMVEIETDPFNGLHCARVRRRATPAPRAAAVRLRCARSRRDARTARLPLARFPKMR